MGRGGRRCFEGEGFPSEIIKFVKQHKTKHLLFDFGHLDFGQPKSSIFPPHSTSLICRLIFLPAGVVPIGKVNCY